MNKSILYIVVLSIVLHGSVLTEQQVQPSLPIDIQDEVNQHGLSLLCNTATTLVNGLHLLNNTIHALRSSGHPAAHSYADQRDDYVKILRLTQENLQRHFSPWKHKTFYFSIQEIKELETDYKQICQCIYIDFIHSQRLLTKLR